MTAQWKSGLRLQRRSSLGQCDVLNASPNDAFSWARDIKSAKRNRIPVPAMSSKQLSFFQWNQSSLLCNDQKDSRCYFICFERNVTHIEDVLWKCMRNPVSVSPCVPAGQTCFQFCLKCFFGQNCIRVQWNAIINTIPKPAACVNVRFPWHGILRGRIWFVWKSEQNNWGKTSTVHIRFHFHCNCGIES